ncbi:MAG TPA: hypothetical protein VH640_17560 [Bryobacteraceae bacterium]|jgi:hypothetical protein
MPTISGWLDADTLVCFMKNEPFLLKVDLSLVTGSGYFAAVKSDGKVGTATSRHYPDDSSGKLIRGLAGRNEIKLPASYFAPDGKSYREFIQSAIPCSERERSS